MDQPTKINGPTRARYVLIKLSAALLLLFFALPTHAQEQDLHDSAEARIEQMMQALGGAPAFDRIESLSTIASCSGPGGAFRTTVDSFRPGHTRFHQVSEDGETEILSNATQTWRLGPDDTVLTLEGNARSFVQGHEFHLALIELNTRFSNHRLGPATTIRGQSCVTILMQDDQGLDASICIRQDTGLPAMLELNPPGAEGPVRTYYQDWYWINGVQYFRAFDLTEGPDRTFRYDYESIQPNSLSALDFIAPVSTDQRDDQSALIAILETDRQAHLQTNAGLLASNVADELINVAYGMAYRQTRPEVEAFFTRVFDGVTYQRWADTEPPLILISDDGTLAWTVRRVSVHRTSPGIDGTMLSSSFISAYSSTYQKQNGEWKMTSVTSTFVPSTED